MLEEGGGGGALEAQIDEVNKQAAQIQSAAKGFASSAGTGFQIEPGAAETLIKACQDSLHELERRSADIDTLSQAPQLGKTPGADVVAPFTQQSATYPHGIAPAIDSLKATLNDMITAYRNASKAYAAHEEQVSDSMKG
jgi:hypothetical protein